MHSSIPQRQAQEAADLASGIQPNLHAFSSPTVVDWSADRALASDIYGFNSIDPRSRSFNLVRGRLLELKRERGFRLIGVASATPNVGKSFVSANVGASLSRDPRMRTFAVDLDLRRGSLSERFGLDDAEEGLGDHLQSGTPLKVCRLDGENLSVIPTRGGNVHSAELLASSRALALFEAMRTSADDTMFLCDLPPVFANDDAVAIMAHLQSYVLVAEEGRTTERELKDSVEALGRERLAGIILNKYRGGLVSDGYGVDSYYAEGYGAGPESRDDAAARDGDAT